MATATGKLFFRHTSQKSREYETIDLSIALESEEYKQRNPDYTRVLTLRWQRTIAEPDRDWYGFSIALDTRDYDDLDHVHAIARKLRGREVLPLGQYTNPKDVLERLQQLKATECAYDAREGEWVELSKIAPPDHKAWRDDWKACGRSGAHVGCLAANEADAKRGIMAEFARVCTRAYGDNDAKVFAQWLEAGQPVISLSGSTSYHGPPDVTPFADRINGHKEK